MVSRVKGRDGRDDNDDDEGGLETAICLLTGAVMRSGKRRTRRSKVAKILVVGRWVLVLVFSALCSLRLGNLKVNDLCCASITVNELHDSSQRHLSHSRLAK